MHLVTYLASGKARSGLLIMSVVPGSAAAKRGLVAGDVITTCDGTSTPRKAVAPTWTVAEGRPDAMRRVIETEAERTMPVPAANAEPSTTICLATPITAPACAKTRPRTS